MPLIQNLIRAIAVLALLNALLDAGRLLGVGAGGASPFDLYSISGFAVLGGFTIARLFASVGMWIRSTWGTPLLFGATLVELLIFLSGVVRLDIGMLGLGARLIELVGAFLVLWTVFQAWRQRIHD